MHRFYLDNSSLATGLELKIADNVLNHMNVLRLKNNDQIELFNGDGALYVAIIHDINRKHAILEITKSILTDNNNYKPKINLICGLISNDKFDLVIQKATELGVDLITPVISKYSQRIPQDRIEQRRKHWQKIMISACEQSKRPLLPKLNQIIEFGQVCDLLKSGTPTEEVCKDKTLSIICEPTPDKSKHSTITNLIQDQDIPQLELINIAIGSEGGFTSDELDIAHQAGFIPLQMGSFVLRAETASIAAITYIRTKLNLWR